MESGTEVLRVVAAIVTTFQTAAELLEHIKDCKEKKKRKRDREFEELLEIKILHKSLVQVSVVANIRALTWELSSQRSRVAFSAADIVRTDRVALVLHLKTAMR